MTDTPTHSAVFTGSVCVSLTHILGLQDLLCYCSLALLLQIAVSAPMAFKASQLDPSISSIIQRVADVFIAAVPSQIPAVISFGLFRCVRALKRKDIHAHDIPRYQIAVHACSNGAFARQYVTS